MKLQEATSVSALMKQTAGWLLILWLLVLPCAAETQMVEVLRFSPNEAESMLCLFNRTPVSGGDVERIAGLGKKLADGFAEAKKQKHAEQTVAIPLNCQEIRYCLAIINQSTFQAKYAGLVLGMKQKLTRLLVPAKNERAPKVNDSTPDGVVQGKSG